MHEKDKITVLILGRLINYIINNDIKLEEYIKKNKKHLPKCITNEMIENLLKNHMEQK